MNDLPTLYAQNKKGSWQEWSIHVDNKDPPVIITLHGQHGGKMIEDRQIVTDHKRSNTLYEQALKMSKSKWNHKRNRESYQEHMLSVESDIRPMPMLAQTYGKKNITFPVHAQPKLDGIRCLARKSSSNEIELYSRTGYLFTSIEHIRKSLTLFFEKYPNIVIDGELYSKDMTFEELSGLCRRETGQATGIVYNIFDVIVNNIGFQERLKYLEELRGIHNISLVETVLVNNKQEIENYLEQCIVNGYEGIILRNSSGKYSVGHRSWDLQKYKKFFEEEFLITGYTEGVGREKGAVIWECETTSGKTFRVRPKGTQDQRREWMKTAESCIGKKLTVIFQEYTQQQVPRFPVAKEIRENY